MIDCMMGVLTTAYAIDGVDTVSSNQHHGSEV